MSKARQDFDVALGLLPAMYPAMRAYAEMGNVRVCDLVASNGKVAPLLGELLAAEGVAELEMESVRDALDILDRYAETGQYDESALSALFDKAKETASAAQKVMTDFGQAGLLNSNYEGAPLVLFVHSYACYALHMIKSLEKYFQEADVPSFSRRQEQARLKGILSSIKRHPQ